MKRFVFAALAAMAVAGCNDAKRTAGVGSTTPNDGVSKSDKVNAGADTSADRDNTAVNERDKSGVNKTPIDQNENKQDIDITANIRKRVVDTKMSVNAQNAKIITQDGKVTLRGPVKTEEEKQRLEEMATEVAGAGNVENLLEVQP